jgi:MFS family permease
LIPQNNTFEQSAEKTSSKKKIWSVGTLTYTSGGLAALFGWLLWGDFAWQMRDRSILPVMQLLFKKYDASDMMVGVLFSSLPLAIGLVTNPVISYLSDRHRGKRGRRIPYLIFTTPLIVGAIIGLAFSPPLGTYLQKLLGSSLGLSLAILIVMGGFWTLFEFACGIANMIFGGLTNDVIPQVVIGRFFGLFRAVSLLAGILFNYWIFGKAEAHYIWLFLGVGLLYGLGFTIMCLKVQEGDYPPPSQVPREAALIKRFLFAAQSYFKEGFGHSYYLWFFASTVFAALALTPANIYILFFAKSLGMNMETYGKYLALSFVISLCLAYPLGSLADRFHPLRMSIISLGLYMLAMLLCAIFVRNAETFGLAIIAHSVLSGCFYTVSLSIPQKLLPRERFAQIGSAGGIIASLVGIVFAPALGIFLDYTHHNYRYTFYIGFFLAALAILLNLVLYRKFMTLGGPKNYMAP